MNIENMIHLILSIFVNNYFKAKIMKNVTKNIDSFSQLTLNLRKRLDEENIPWIDNSGVIDREWNKLILERTWIGEHVEINEYGLSAAYVYNPDLDMGYSYGYPDKLECCTLFDCETALPMSIDEIIDFYKEIRERNDDEHCM